MKFLLDTDTIIYWMNNEPKVVEKVRKIPFTSLIKNRKLDATIKFDMLALSSSRLKSMLGRDTPPLSRVTFKQGTSDQGDRWFDRKTRKKSKI